MRLAHFSDPHLLDLSGAGVTDFFNKRWLGGLNLVANRGRQHRPEVFQAMVDEINRAEVDHVLCTGDVTNVALPSEFRYARKEFERLRHATDDVTVIPGNHDAYVAEGLHHFESAFGAYTTSDSEWQWPGGERWPVVRVRGPLAVVAVTSSLATPWFQAWGRVGDGQLARLAAVLSDPRLADKCRLVAIHHPPAGLRAQNRVRGLKDHAAFAEVIRRAGAELILHGHEHLDLSESLAGAAGAPPVPVRGIPSATFDGRSEILGARFRIYEIAAAAGSRAEIVHEEAWAWQRSRGGFTCEQRSARQAIPAPT